MASFSCACEMDMDMVNSDNSAKAAPDDHVGSSCHMESLSITAMDHGNTHRRSSMVAEAPVREDTAITTMVPSGACKSILCPCPPHMEKPMMAWDSSLNDISAEGVPTQNQMGDLSYYDDSVMSQPMSMVSSSSLSNFSSGVQKMHDHHKIIEGEVSEVLYGHSSNNNRTRRGRTRLMSSCNRRGHCRRNNYGGRSSSRVLPVLIMTLCSISLAAANVFGATTTAAAATTSNSMAVTTTDAPLNATTPCNYSIVDDDLLIPCNYSVAVVDDDFISTTNATTTSTTTTTTTTIGGLKLIDNDDEYIPPCPTLNKGQCQQNFQHCTWKVNSWSCDYSHLPVTSTSTPTTLNSRPPPSPPTGSLSNAPSPKPTPNSTATPPTGGNKGLTDTPTFQSSPPPTTKLPTPVPTRLPTLLPTPKPTTRAPTNVPTMKPTTKAPTKEPTDEPTYSPTMDPTKRPTVRPTRNP